MADHDLALPTAPLPHDHRVSGQAFVRHIAQCAPWQAWRLPGLEARDTGVAAATDGLAAVRVVRPVSGCSRQADHKAHAQRHATELCFYFVLQGQLELRLEEGPLITLGHDDCVTLPGDTTYILLPCADLEWLEAVLPAAPHLGLERPKIKALACQARALAVQASLQRHRAQHRNHSLCRMALCGPPGFGPSRSIPLHHGQLEMKPDLLTRTTTVLLACATAAAPVHVRAQVPPTATEAAAYQGLHAAAHRGDLAAIGRLAANKAALQARDSAWPHACACGHVCAPAPSGAGLAASGRRPGRVGAGSL